jgi:hypothetical protein
VVIVPLARAAAQVPPCAGKCVRHRPQANKHKSAWVNGRDAAFDSGIVAQAALGRVQLQEGSKLFWANQIEQFSNSRALASFVQGGFFLRKKLPASCFRCAAICGLLQAAGKVPREKLEVSGHDFSRAEDIAESLWALALEGCFSLARDGKTIATADVPALKAPTDLVPKTAQVTLAVPAGADLKGASVTVECGCSVPEITLMNNSVTL